MAGETGLTIDLAEFNRTLRRLLVQGLQEGGLMIWQVGQTILSAASGYAPIEWGTLKASGVSDPKDAGPLNYEIGFNTDYAAAVHERLDLHHDKGQAKYFERAIREDGPEIFRKQAEHYAARMGLN